MGDCLLWQASAKPNLNGSVGLSEVSAMSTTLFVTGVQTLCSSVLQQYWKLQELRQRTQQPDSAIKAALAGVAELVKRGEHRGKYQLKPEYQQG